MDGEFREQCFGLLVGDGRVNDHVISFLPVYGGGDAMFITDLKS
jgi:hypothetical protein